MILLPPQTNISSSLPIPPHSKSESSSRPSLCSALMSLTSFIIHSVQFWLASKPSQPIGLGICHIVIFTDVWFSGTFTSLSKSSRICQFLVCLSSLGPLLRRRELEGVEAPEEEYSLLELQIFVLGIEGIAIQESVILHDPAILD